MTDQDLWDQFLINCWFSSKGSKMYAIDMYFKNAFPAIDVTALNRYPSRGDMLMRDVFNFVAQHIPKLSKWLDESDGGDMDRRAKLLRAIKLCEFQGNCANESYARQASNAARYASKKAAAQRASGAASKKHSIKSNGHDWNTVK